jgi:integration host factor subunit beta
LSRGSSALTRSDLIAELAASNPHLRGADVELIAMTVFDQPSRSVNGRWRSDPETSCIPVPRARRTRCRPGRAPRVDTRIAARAPGTPPTLPSDGIMRRTSPRRWMRAGSTTAMNQPTPPNRKPPLFARCPVCGTEFCSNSGQRWCTRECAQDARHQITRQAKRTTAKKVRP